MRSTRMSFTSLAAQAQALAPLADGGAIRFYSGPPPDDGDAPVESQTLLAELALGSPAFGVSGGVLTAMPIASSVAVADGNAVWARVVGPGGDALWDCMVGVGDDFNIRVSTTHFVAGVTVSCDEFVHVIAAQTAGM